MEAPVPGALFLEIIKCSVFRTSGPVSIEAGMLCKKKKKKESLICKSFKL